MSKEPEGGFIIIVARNNVHLTKRAYKTARGQDYPCRVLVVNNASTDGTAAWIQSAQCSETVVGTTVLTYAEQQSVAKTWNDALWLAWHWGYQEALVINNDVELRPDTYSVLRNVLQEYCLSLATGVSVDTREQFQAPNPASWSFSSHPDFSCFMITRLTNKLVGPFDEGYFPAYCEDSDYHVRMHRLELEATSIDLPFYHKRSQTLKNASPEEQHLIRKAADRNRERFRQRYGCSPDSPEYALLFQSPVRVQNVPERTPTPEHPVT